MRPKGPFLNIGFQANGRDQPGLSCALEEHTTRRNVSFTRDVRKAHEVGVGIR